MLDGSGDKAADTAASGGFALRGRPALARSTVERDETLRKDPALLERLWRQGRVLVVDKSGRTPVDVKGMALALRETADFGERVPEGSVLLGTADGVGYFSVVVEEPMAGEVPVPGGGWSVRPGQLSEKGEHWHDLRSVGGLLDDTAAGLLTTAVAVHAWHDRARFCARCGSPVHPTAAGWATRCTSCGCEEYPRTDPAVICLVHDREGLNGERVLLARQPVWPAGRYSVLAGFVEAGESLEACVEREVAEEVGVQVADIRYLGSQPWPFPRSLMIAFAATADPDQPLHPADGEIEEAHWVTRAEVQAALADPEGTDLKLPGETSIASLMLAGWANASTNTN